MFEVMYLLSPFKIAGIPKKQDQGHDSEVSSVPIIMAVKEIDHGNCRTKGHKKSSISLTGLKPRGF